MKPAGSPAGRASRVSARRPTYLFCFAKRRRREKATPMMAVRASHGLHTSLAPETGSVGTRCAQTADASYPFPAPATCRPRRGPQRQKQLQLQLQRPATDSGDPSIHSLREHSGRTGGGGSERTATATVAARANRNRRCAELTTIATVAARKNRYPNPVRGSATSPPAGAFSSASRAQASRLDILLRRILGRALLKQLARQRLVPDNPVLRHRHPFRAIPLLHLDRTRSLMVVT
jgi:hypothetical protein